MSGFDEKVLTIESLEEMLEACGGKISGTDTNDGDYDSIRSLWQKELASETNGKLDWYNKGFEYWEAEANCPLSDDGVLGGYGKLTPVDVRDSNKFLDEVIAIRPELNFNKAADCGAGIGRVSKHFLLSRFAHVDLIEQSPRLLASSAKYIGEPDCQRTTCVLLGLQDFNPEPASYDVIWIQWVIGHLHDLDFVTFFRFYF